MAPDSFRQLISGRRRGFVASLQRAALALLALLYGLGVRLRNLLYRLGLKRIHRAPGIVVSVGNITAGGTGKTPVVAFLANWFQQHAVSAAILSRGYKSFDSGENDEKLVLDRLCPGIPHVQDPDRVASAERAVASHNARVLVLDDAFQHRRIHRDLNLLLVDATNPWGYGRLLPRGLLREPLSEVARADLVIVTRADQIPADELTQLRRDIERQTNTPNLLTSRFAPTGWLTLGGESLPLDAWQDRPAVAFCGIGNPAGFAQTLQSAGYRVLDLLPFPDHHHYTPEDCRTIAATASHHGADLLLTTLKDLVKLPPDAFPNHTVAALQIEFEILDGADLLLSRLDDLAPTPLPE